MRRKKAPDETLRAPKHKPKITISKNGTILFNPPASKLLNLEKGIRVSFASDYEEPHDWFVFIDPRDGFELHLGSDNKTIFFTHRRLVQEFFKAHTALRTNNTYKFYIYGHPITIVESKTKYWRIIVATE
jgi:hypothetical protein